MRFYYTNGGMEMVLLAVNFVCNNNCSFCSVNANQGLQARKAVPKKEELLKLIDSLASQGERKLKISGGEPTVRKDLPELVSHARKSGFSTISLDTNGRRLSEESYLKELLAAGISSFEISLLGATPKTHDSITGRENSLRETLVGLKNVCSFKKKLGLFISVDFVILKQNIQDIQSLGPLLNPLPIDLLSFVFVKPQGRAVESYKRLAPSYTETRNQLSKLKSRHSTILLDFPFCVLKGLNPPFFATKQNYSAFVFLDKTKKHSHNMTKWTKETCVKVPACKTCVYSKSCPGTWPEYLKVYGSDELIPLKERIGVIKN